MDIAPCLKKNKKSKAKSKMVKGKNGRGSVGEGEENIERERERFFFFSSLISKIYRNWDHRFSLEQEAKFIYATRATRGHQNLGVSSNSTR